MRADAAVITYLAYLSAFFYWHLAAFFDGNFNALFGRNLPATDLRNLEWELKIRPDKESAEQTYVRANLLGNGATTLLGHLLATLVRHLMARRVSHLKEKRPWRKKSVPIKA